MPSVRVFAEVNCTPPVVPKGMYQVPPREPPAPPAQNPVPSMETAIRTLFTLNAVVKRVEVSTLPAASIRATTRLTAAAVVPVMLDVPGTAAYPARVRYRPSVDKARLPSDVPLPESLKG